MQEVTGAQVAHGPRSQHSAPVEHHHPIAGALDVGEDVRREQHADPELTQALYQPQHVLASGGVQSGRRLVEEHQFRVVDDGLRQLHPLPHPGGEVAQIAEPLLVQADEEQDL